MVVFFHNLPLNTTCNHLSRDFVTRKETIQNPIKERNQGQNRKQIGGSNTKNTALLCEGVRGGAWWADDIGVHAGPTITTLPLYCPTFLVLSKPFCQPFWEDSVFRRVSSKLGQTGGRTRVWDEGRGGKGRGGWRVGEGAGQSGGDRCIDGIKEGVTLSFLIGMSVFMFFFSRRYLQ